MTIRKHCIFNPLSLIAVICMLTACGPGEPEGVEERSQARWNLMVERNFSEAWNYYTPGFRETTPREDFAYDMDRRPLRWHNAEVLESQCEGDRCTVTVSITYQAVTAPAGQNQMRMTRNIEDQWIRLDGQWWYVTN